MSKVRNNVRGSKKTRRIASDTGRGGGGGGGRCKGVFYDLQVGRRAADRRLDVPAL